MAAIAATGKIESFRGNTTAAPSIFLLERNATVGRKLLLTGGQRCNLTHAGLPDSLLPAYRPCDRFLRHVMHTFSPDIILDFFHEHGLPTSVDAEGCVFPVSQKAADVKLVLERQIRRLDVTLIPNRRVETIQKTPEGFQLTADRETFFCRIVILATGGKSYPKTGSTGDGYRLAASLGHTIEPPRSILVPLIVHQRWPSRLAGVTIERVRLRANPQGKKITLDGPLVFTQDGLGGPTAQNFSRLIADHLANTGSPVEVSLDFLPELDAPLLQQKLAEQIERHPRQKIANIISSWLPFSLANQLCKKADCETLIASQLPRSKRKDLLLRIKDSRLHVARLRSLDEAVVTRGGIALPEIDPKTMQSRLCRGLFLAGEIMNVDGPCGGYNLQIAWATGALAGQSAYNTLHTNLPIDKYAGY